MGQALSKVLFGWEESRLDVGVVVVLVHQPALRARSIVLYDKNRDKSRLKDQRDQSGWKPTLRSAAWTDSFHCVPWPGWNRALQSIPWRGKVEKRTREARHSEGFFGGARLSCPVRRDG